MPTGNIITTVTNPTAALRFGAGTGDRVNCSNGSIINNMTQITALAWAYPTNTIFRDILSKYRGATAEGWVWCNVSATPGNQYFEWNRATQAFSQGTTGGVVANTWQCLAVVAEQATPSATFYRGSLTSPMALETNAATTVGSGGFNSDSARSLFLGNRDIATPNQSFIGNISTIAIFNAILTPSQIESWKQQPRKQVGSYVAVGFWRLNNASTITDESGNGNSGTVTGATLNSGPDMIYF